ncbi:MAG: hypothetical protein KGL39_00370 [Patescibacteria group bacterium]|nr:hypothetical protein [Patescibacteria group bacterium]
MEWVILSMYVAAALLVMILFLGTESHQDNVIMSVVLGLGWPLVLVYMVTAIGWILIQDKFFPSGSEYGDGE